MQILLCAVQVLSKTSPIVAGLVLFMLAIIQVQFLYYTFVYRTCPQHVPLVIVYKILKHSGTWAGIKAALVN